MERFEDVRGPVGCIREGFLEKGTDHIHQRFIQAELVLGRAFLER